MGSVGREPRGPSPPSVDRGTSMVTGSRCEGHTQWVRTSARRDSDKGEDISHYVWCRWSVPETPESKDIDNGNKSGSRETPSWSVLVGV